MKGKKITSMIMGLLLMLSVTTYAKVDKQELVPSSARLYVNTKLINEGLFIYNDLTLAPLRVVSEMLECKVDFNAETRVILMTKADQTIELTIGETQAKVNNGGRVDIGCPVIQNEAGVTYVPLRFISEQFQQVVQYNKAADCIAIYDTNNPSYEGLKSPDLLTRRFAALSMPNASIHPSMMGSYFAFPIGEHDRFFRYDGEPNTLTYYVLENGIWVDKWQGKYKEVTEVVDGSIYISYTEEILSESEIAPPYTKEDAYIGFGLSAMFTDFPADLPYYKNGVMQLYLDGNTYYFKDQDIQISPYMSYILADTKDEKLSKYLSNIEVLLEVNEETGIKNLISLNHPLLQ